MAAPLLAALGLPLLGLAGGAMSMFGGAMSLGGGLLHAGSTAVGLGAKGIGAIGKAAGGLIPGGEGGGSQMQPAQQGLPDINGKYFNDNTQRWHDRSNNNRFTTAPAQFGAQGMAGGSGLAGGVGGGEQMEMDFGGTGSMNEPEEVGPFGMLIGLLAGMANDISAIKGLTSGILSTMVANEAEDDQQDAQMSLFSEEQLAQGQEAQQKAQDLMDKGEREGSLTDTGTGGKGSGQTPGVLSKLFGAGKSGMGKLLNQPNWIKAIGLGGLLWWLSNNKEGFIKGLTGVLEFVRDTVDDFDKLGPLEGSKKLLEKIGNGILNLFEKINESEFMTSLKASIVPFVENFFAMIWQMTKELAFGKSGEGAVHESAGEGLAAKSTLTRLAEEVGAPEGKLTKKFVKNIKSPSKKSAVKAQGQVLWDEMREISRESGGRVQWTGIESDEWVGLGDWANAYTSLGIEKAAGWGLRKVWPAGKYSIFHLMSSIPIVDGYESTWEDLKTYDFGAALPEGATVEETQQAEDNLAMMSDFASQIKILKSNIAASEAGENIYTGPDILGRRADKKELEKLTADFKALAAGGNWEESKIAHFFDMAGIDYLPAQAGGNVVLPELVESDVQDTATTTTKEVKKVAAEVVKKVTNGAVPEVQNAGFMEAEWVKEYIANLQKMANPFGDPNDAPLFDDVDEIEDYRDMKMLENEELKMKINRKDPDRLNKLLKAMGIDSQAATFGNLEMTETKNIGGTNGFGTFAQSGDQIPIAQMKASVKSYLNKEYTKDEWDDLSATNKNHQIRIAKHKIRTGEVLLVPNPSTEQLNAVTATSNQMEMEKASGTGAFTSIKQGDKIVNSSNTYTQSRIGSTNEEWTQKAALANALRFSGLSFPTN